MTDNEIIKALNYCCGNIKNNDEECNEDMCYQVCLPESREEGIRWCGEWLMKDALDLINRQKAEIEEWKKKANTPFAKVTFDRDKLQEIVDECAKNIEIDINLAKSEAIKEFAERLKENIRNAIDTYYNSYGGGYYHAEDTIDDIDILVKEMTEVQE